MNNLFFYKYVDDRNHLVLSLLGIFPLCTYLLNAGMYIDAKILIPFLLGKNPLFTNNKEIFLSFENNKFHSFLKISII